MNAAGCTALGRRVGVAVLLAMGWGLECLGAEPPVLSEARSPVSRLEAGEGLVIWESNRSSAWRLWWSPLETPSPRPLTLDEPGRAHCCPHLSPDGRRLLWVSLPADQATYPRAGARGSLHLLNLETGEDRILLSSVQTYFEHRAATWIDDDEIVVIQGTGPEAGRSQLLSTLDPRRSRVLTGPVAPPYGWLPDPTLQWATSGSPTFSSFSVDGTDVIERPELGGCQPWFSSDGRWGFWVAGAGGPIQRIDLRTRSVTTILRKRDDRLPPDRGYLYFPMLSRNGDWFTWAASNGQHPHDRADYDVFAAPIDPGSLDLLGPPHRITKHPGVDRFPEVRGPELSLGRHIGEEPFSIEISLPSGEWIWSVRPVSGGRPSSELGQFAEGRGTTLATTLQAGRWALEARRGDSTLRGRAHVRPSSPPEIAQISVRPADQIEIAWTEPLAETPRIEPEAGPAIRSLELSDDQRTVRLRLESPLEETATLLLGVTRDRAGHESPSQRLEVAPPGGPVRPSALALHWRGPGQDEGWVDSSGSDAWSRFDARGRTWGDERGGAELRGGSWLADPATTERVLSSARTHNEISLALSLSAATPRDAGTILEFGAGEGRSTNFRLDARDGTLRFRLRVPTAGRDASGAEVDLGPVPDRPVDLALSYSPGRLQIARSDRPSWTLTHTRGGFFHWRLLPFVLGNSFDEENPWTGQLGDLSIWGRALEDSELDEEIRRRRDARDRRTDPEVKRVKARLIERSPVPHLREIAPYREALAVSEYRVEGTGEPLRVVHRVLHGGEVLPIADRKVDGIYSLELAPFSARLDLEGLILSDTLPERWDLTLWWSGDIGD